MSERVTMSTGPDGTPVAHKQIHDSSERPSLTHEARLLRLADHPGVVRLLEEGDDHLHLAWVGSHSLATRPPRTLPPAAGLLISLVTTVADLHQVGIAHGAIEADHVLLDGRGRPVLCSLRAAVAAPSPADAEHRERAADDVAALGRLIGQVVDGLGPTRRWDHRRQGRAVRRLALRIAADAPARRPSARALATALADAAPCARLPNDPPPPEAPLSSGHALSYLDALRPTEEPVTDDPQRRPWSVVLLGALVAGAIVLLATSGTGQQAPTPTPAPQASATPAGPAAPMPSTTLGPSPACPAAPPTDIDGTSPPTFHQHDLDGDGCPDPVTIAGTSIQTATRRWEVGQEDDVVTIGDWDCDGVATPALLRPATGEVFVFTTWAAPAARVDASPVALHPDAVDLTAPTTCGSLVVVDAEDHRTPVALAPPDPVDR